MGRFLINDISVGPLTFHVYGLMMALGILTAYLVTEHRGKKKGMDIEPFFGLFLWAIFGGFLGAKLLFYIVNIPEMIQDPGFFLRNFANGWIVYGAIIGGALAVYLYCRVKKMDVMQWLDLLMPSLALAQGFGRVGCLFAGCCYGVESHTFLGIVYEHSNFAPNGVELVPTQIISSLGNFVIAFILMTYAKKEPQKGKVAALYFILYSVGRFFVEFFRNDHRGAIGPLSTSQIISVFILIFGIFLFSKKFKKTVDTGN
jgi:phosphatidylglycerol:prolipoprotein diacylglycerol transferase